MWSGIDLLPKCAGLPILSVLGIKKLLLEFSELGAPYVTHIAFQSHKSHTKPNKAIKGIHLVLDH